MEMFEAARVKEFKSLIIRYLEDHMAHQAQVLFFIIIEQNTYILVYDTVLCSQLIKYWEAFVPEAKVIA